MIRKLFAVLALSGAMLWAAPALAAWMAARSSGQTLALLSL